MLLESPFGAFHHCVDSLVLHDAHNMLLRGCFTIEPSESSSTTGGDGAFVFLLETRSFLIWALNSLSFELQLNDQPAGFKTRRRDDTLLPMAIVSDDFVHGSGTDLLADEA